MEGSGGRGSVSDSGLQTTMLGAVRSQNTQYSSTMVIRMTQTDPSRSQRVSSAKHTACRTNAWSLFTGSFISMPD